jgi:calcium-dependent protein kinase
MIETDHASVAIRERYKDTGRLLGEGTFGQVFLFEERDKPGVYVAIKIMRKDLLTDAQMEVIRDEISILASLDHRHIIKHIESYEDPRYMYIIMEEMRYSKSLEEMIKEKKMNNANNESNPHAPLFSETEIRHLSRMILSALLHIHKNGITHRDLKPENILIDYRTNELKIIDFGLSKNDSYDDDVKKVLIGTPHYMAPEIFLQSGSTEAYHPPVDMWSLGIIIYLLVTGFLPWKGENAKEIETEIIKNRVTFHQPCFKTFSTEGLNILAGLLELEPVMRMTSEQAIGDDFFKAEGYAAHVSDCRILLDKEVLTNLTNYRAENQLKKAAIHLLVRACDQE